jgi:hypothetical protein
MDTGSRRILGFALGEHHDAALAYGALAMAVAARGGTVPGVVFHTDYAEVDVKPENLRLAWSGPPADGFPGLTFLVIGDCRGPVAGFR